MAKLTSQIITRVLDEHIHMPCLVYPTLANGVAVLGGGAWALDGAFVPIVPINTITERFDIHHICIEALSVNEVYEIVLYAGAAQTEIGRVRVVKNAAQDGTMNIPMQTPIIDANSKIEAKVATAGGTDTATLSIFYHTYH